MNQRYLCIQKYDKIVFLLCYKSIRMFLNLKIRLKEIFARTLKINKDDHTPIMFDDYNTNSYYYILNNNKNNIYSLNEVYTLFQNKKITFRI